MQLQSVQYRWSRSSRSLGAELPLSAKAPVRKTINCLIASFWRADSAGSAGHILKSDARAPILQVVGRDYVGWANIFAASLTVTIRVIGSTGDGMKPHFS